MHRGSAWPNAAGVILRPELLVAIIGTLIALGQTCGCYRSRTSRQHSVQKTVLESPTTLVPGAPSLVPDKPFSPSLSNGPCPQPLSRAGRPSLDSMNSSPVCHHGNLPRAVSGHLGGTPPQGGSGRISFSEKWPLGSEVAGVPSEDLPGNHELPKGEEVLFWFTWKKKTHRGRGHSQAGVKGSHCPAVHPSAS